jgi:nucleotide-binding universal stress UspA family protein
MNKRMLVGIDLEISPPTQQALSAVSELLEPPSSYEQVVLLAVIPTLDPSYAKGRYHVPLSAMGSTTEQRRQADQALQKACLILTGRGVDRKRIELLRREGAPAEEIVKAAQFLGVDCIVLGSHQHTFLQTIRRLITGSVSRQVLQHPPCPILIVVHPRTPAPRDLVAWYEEAVTRYLSVQAGRLTILTPSAVASTFVPAHHMVGHNEVLAATRALERLASKGLLCGQWINGELRYLNDCSGKGYFSKDETLTMGWARFER